MQCATRQVCGEAGLTPPPPKHCFHLLVLLPDAPSHSRSPAHLCMPLLVRVGNPVAAAVGGVDLVNQQDVA